MDGTIRTQGKERGSRLTGILLFAIKFAVAATLCTTLWWLVTPSYLHVMGRIVALCLRVTGVDVQGVSVQVAGILNTDSLLIFSIRTELGIKPAEIPAVSLAMNIPTYVSLVLATAGLALKQRANKLFLGLAILVASHIFYVLLVFWMGSHAPAARSIPAMIVMLPFLLWIVLVYWQQIAGLLLEDDEEPDES